MWRKIWKKKIAIVKYQTTAKDDALHGYDDDVLRGSDDDDDASRGYDDDDNDASRAYDDNDDASCGYDNDDATRGYDDNARRGHEDDLKQLQLVCQEPALTSHQLSSAVDSRNLIFPCTVCLPYCKPWSAQHLLWQVSTFENSFTLYGRVAR